ncbi:uracil-DNA glycosylase family protein [Echinicola sp. CAU 1574]|uniref:Uracil-DNA glycosylase family protein n=1 Tax=Echinicola arenosa TaxID=2774144 RepID=A0ABR9AL43_9BACT|nr:uracil-DNA glycosylase family protein [Echinicola arenosa]MBD8489525.1 uracil-DNA glycosylase family protein [Echinicola arenosa]
MKELLKEIRNCTVCTESLPFGPNPVVRASAKSQILIIGQAPGKKVHESSIPWNDQSGDNLRRWLGVGEETFYDASQIALVPMGFCYPGTGKSGDLPPRPECAPLWHERLLKLMPLLELTILVGNYAQAYYLKGNIRKTLTETVKNYESYLPAYWPLPHPSPRNNIWQAKNPWFAKEVLPNLKSRVEGILKL